LLHLQQQRPLRFKLYALFFSVKISFPDKDNTMKCPKCKTENPKDAQFCGECGATLRAAAKTTGPICPSCGEAYTSEEAFCKNCGAVLAEKKAPKEKGGRSRYFSRDERYRLAKELALKTIHSEDKGSARSTPIIYIGEKII
jgi:predicted amidophosphoribosyltransferase